MELRLREQCCNVQPIRTMHLLRRLGAAAFRRRIAALLSRRAAHTAAATDGAVLTLTMSRPEEMNAFTPQMCEELCDALRAADSDDAIRAVVLTGDCAGKAFCAGASLASGGFDLVGRRPDGTVPPDMAGTLVLQLIRMRKPVIAAVNGAAVGVGATMLLGCDIVLCAERAKFGFVFTQRGVVPEGLSSFLLPRVVGVRRAFDWVMTGRMVGAQEALEGSLVTRVVKESDGVVLDEAQAAARNIAETTSALSVSISRQMLWRAIDDGGALGKAHTMESHSLIHAIESGDATEGVASFFERRPASFKAKAIDDSPPWLRDPEFLARDEVFDVKEVGTARREKGN